MKKIETVGDLREQIRILEEQTMILEDRLKVRFDAGYEGIKPLNLIKQVLPALASIPFLKSSLLNTALGLGLGYIAKRIISRKSKNHPAKERSDAAASNGQKKHGWFKRRV